MKADAMEDVVDTSDVEEKELIEAQKPGYYDNVWGALEVRSINKLARNLRMTYLSCRCQMAKIWIWGQITLLEHTRHQRL